MPTLAAYPGMMQRARKREGLRVCRAAWLVGVIVREYREMEAGGVGLERDRRRVGLSVPRLSSMPERRDVVADRRVLRGGELS